MTLPPPLQAFAEYNQFVIYKMVPNSKGKVDKVPFCPMKGSPINPHNLTSMMSYHDAMEYVNALPHGHLGFVLTDNDPWWFVDIDNCIDESGNYNDVAKDLILMLPTAAVEVSSSGKGLHIFGYGIPPDHKCKNKDFHIELYHKSRFIAFGDFSNVTGDMNQDFTGHIAAVVEKYFKRDAIFNDESWSDTPHPNWRGIDDDDELIAKACRSKSGQSVFGGKASFSDLWKCNTEVLIKAFPTSEEGKDFDRSSADASLAQHLAFWTGSSCGRMERLMLASSLNRDKWQVHRTYLRTTIIRAKAMQQTFHQLPVTQEEAITSFNDGLNKKNLDNLVSQNGGEVIGHGMFAQSVGFSEIKTNGKPKGTYTNFLTLVSALGVQCRYNTMTHKSELSIPNHVCAVNDNVDNNTLNLLKSACISVELPHESLDGYVDLLATDNWYHPVAEWIGNIQWDGVDRIDEMVRTLDSDNPELTRLLLVKWSVGALNHVFDESPKSSGVLVLQGDQNLGKTRWLMNLVKNHPEFTKEGVMLDPSRVDSVVEATSTWLVELGELDGTFRKSDVAQLKAFLTRDHDEYRSPYARKSSRHPRRTVFAASVNGTSYLTDETGNRRYWSIGVGERMNPDHSVDTDQYWAQIETLRRSGSIVTWLQPHELDQLNRHNEAFTQVNAELEILNHHYDITVVKSRWLSISEILREIGIDPSHARRWSNAVRKFSGEPKGVRTSRGNTYPMPVLKNPFSSEGHS